MVEVRTTGTATRQGKRLVGIAAPFDSLSVDLGGFRERIKPGAFRRSLEAGHAIALIHNHDTGAVLASTANGSLKLRETARGLEFSAVPADTGLGRDLLTLAERGDLAHMSFGFRVRGSNGERWYESGSEIHRDLLEVELFEISTTAFPAYPASTVSARTAEGDDQPVKRDHSKTKRRLVRDILSRNLSAAEAVSSKPLPAPKPTDPRKLRMRRERLERELAQRQR